MSKEDKIKLDDMEIIKGTQTGKTGAWTGTSSVITSLYDGLTIKYYLNRDPSGNASLNLTLADGSTTGAIPCYYNSGRLTTHYAVGSVITLTYFNAGSITVNGTATTDNRWIADANYDSGNTNTATRQIVRSTNANYSLLFADRVVGTATNNTSYYTYRNDSIYVNPSTGNLYATTFTGDLTGNADTATAIQTAGTTAQFYRGDNSWSNEIVGGLLKITNKSNTVTIGSNNTTWCHFTNSANIPFYFNKAVHVDGDIYYYNTKVHMSSSGFHPPKNGGIYWDPYVESTSDASDVSEIVQVSSGAAGGTELRIRQANDSTDIINLMAPNYIYLNSKKAFTINDKWLRINDGGGFTDGIYCGSSLLRTDGQIQVGQGGINFYANSSGYGYFRSSLGIAGMNYSYKLYVKGNTAIEGNLIFPAANIFDWNDGTYRQRLVITDDSTANTAVFTFQQSSDSGRSYKDLLVIRDNGAVYADAIYGAVWNDYAEYRESIVSTPGTCVVENDNGILSISDERLTPGASIISDTYGFSQGETERAQTPIAVSGRVLAYTYMPREMYHAGMAVCSAPGGTIDAMTREEIRNYPDAIIGIVSEIPDYEEWGTNNIKVDGRIWIKVRY